MKSPIFFLALCLLVTACAPRGALTFADVRTNAEVQTVFVATNRGASVIPDDFVKASDVRFGPRRAGELKFAKFEISIPPVHELGKIEWSRDDDKADANRHFAIVSADRLSGSTEFLANVNKALPRGEKEVVVMVHGYNNNDAEASFRLAQVVHDYKVTTPAISFSWPSAGHPGAYAYDRDSVIFSRDALERLLTILARDGKKIQVVAHSMGSQLVMETLRQMSIGKNQRPLRAIAGITLISPDIDDEVFFAQANRISPFPQPFTLLVSESDHILNLSAWLTGKPQRLGSIRDRDQLKSLPIQVVDLTKFKGGDQGGHTKAFSAPRAITFLSRLLR